MIKNNLHTKEQEPAFLYFHRAMLTDKVVNMILVSFLFGFVSLVRIRVGIRIISYLKWCLIIEESLPPAIKITEVFHIYL